MLLIGGAGNRPAIWRYNSPLWAAPCHRHRTGAKRGRTAKSAGANVVLIIVRTRSAQQVLERNGGAPVDQIIEVEFGQISAGCRSDKTQRRIGGLRVLPRLMEPTTPFLPCLFKAVNPSTSILVLPC